MKSQKDVWRFFMWVSIAQSVKLADQNGKGGVSATEQATANEKRAGR
jgi:hypothetical protein